ncbi:MAG: hypothetical protein WA091_03570 [Minisyncoccales bacterium]|jgi:hypothetical protein
MKKSIKQKLEEAKNSNNPLEIMGLEPYIVRWKDIECVLGKKEYKKFMDWMCTQTCVDEGAYSWDVRRYLWRKSSLYF